MQASRINGWGNRKKSVIKLLNLRKRNKKKHRTIQLCLYDIHGRLMSRRWKTSILNSKIKTSMTLTDRKYSRLGGMKENWKEFFQLRNIRVFHSISWLYNNLPDIFLRHWCGQGTESAIQWTSGHQRGIGLRKSDSHGSEQWKIEM